jgi:hypothetical protein
VVGQHAHAGAGEREAGWWVGLRGGVPLAMEREGMTGGARLRKENKEKEYILNSNLKLIFQFYSNRTFPNLENLK